MQLCYALMLCTYGVSLQMKLCSFGDIFGSFLADFLQKNFNRRIGFSRRIMYEFCKIRNQGGCHINSQSFRKQVGIQWNSKTLKLRFSKLWPVTVTFKRRVRK